MIWTALRLVPSHGFLLVTWIAVVLLATWPRFPQQVLPDFLNGMRALLQKLRAVDRCCRDCPGEEPE